MVNPFIIFIKVGVVFMEVIPVSCIFNVSVPEFVQNFPMFDPTNDQMIIVGISVCWHVEEC